MRTIGSLMAVREDGATSGYVSNGCVDADIVAQAQMSLQTGEARTCIYGEGSPYKDIILPCGGTIKLLLLPSPAQTVIQSAVKALQARNSLSLRFDITEGLSLTAGKTLDWNGQALVKPYAPPLRFCLAGRGEALRAMVALCAARGSEYRLYTPEPDSFEGHVYHLKDPRSVPDIELDAWTALVLMFHDHDWEPALLTLGFGSDAFYIGAMGSRRTAETRRLTLSDMGVAPSQIARVRGPIGLIPSMRDANNFAVSVMADIISVAQKTGRLR